MGDNRVSELIAALVVLYGLAMVFTLLRIYVRVYVSKNWGLDDSLLIATMAMFTVYTTTSALGIKYGTGRHAIDIPKEDLPIALMYWWLGEILYTFTTVLLRLSISLFLLRICVKRWNKYLIWGTMAVVGVFSTFYFLLAIFQCHPVSYFWEQFAGAQGSCIEKSVFPNATYAHSAVSATADFILGLLPVSIIWDLKMNLRTKLSVGVVLSLGVVAGLGTLIRIPYIRVLAITDDFLYATVDVAIWSTVEPALGIIAASACVLRPLFKKFYDLSSHGTYPTHTPRTAGSTWRRSRLTGRSIAIDDGLELGQRTAEMSRAKSVITSGGALASTSNHIGSQGREKKGVTFHQKSITSSNSSQEELTPVRGAGGGGIQVHKTVEVVRTHRRADTDSDSKSSAEYGPPTPWPKA